MRLCPVDGGPVVRIPVDTLEPNPDPPYHVGHPTHVCLACGRTWDLGEDTP